MKKVLISLLTITILSSCATREKYNNKMKEWIGKPKEDLVLSKGIPDKNFQVNKNTELLAYEYSVISSDDGGSNQWWCKTTFTITDGLVTDVSSRGNACRSY